MFWTACKIFLAMTLLTGCVYPFLVTEIGTIIMPDQAYGSLIFHQGKLKGSKLIAQPFVGEKYFWPRPSTPHYNALNSSGSNLGPTSRKLKESVEKRAQNLQSQHSTSHLPVDMLYASGSGLDPHISVEAAYFQLERVARSRSLNAEKLRQFIDQMTEGKSGILGPQHINVLLLNTQLDQQVLSSK